MYINRKYTNSQRTKSRNNRVGCIFGLSKVKLYSRWPKMTKNSLLCQSKNTAKNVLSFDLTLLFDHDGAYPE